MRVCVPYINVVDALIDVDGVDVDGVDVDGVDVDGVDTLTSTAS